MPFMPNSSCPPPPSRPAPHRERKGASQLDSEARRERTWDPEHTWGPMAGRQYPPLRPQPEDPATSSSGSGPLSPPRHVQSLRGQPGREKKVQSLFWETLRNQSHNVLWRKNINKEQILRICAFFRSLSPNVTSNFFFKKQFLFFNYS